MSKLDSLTQFIKAHLPARIANLEFTSDMDGLRFIPAQRELGLDQYQLAVMQFEVVLSWGRFPFRLFDPRNLCALLMSWLIEHTDEGLAEQGFDLEMPEIVILADTQTAVVEVTLTLYEALTVVRDAEGLIPFDGDRWRLSDPQIWWALEGTVYGADATGAPIGKTS